MTFPKRRGLTRADRRDKRRWAASLQLLLAAVAAVVSAVLTTQGADEEEYGAEVDTAAGFFRVKRLLRSSNSTDDDELCHGIKSPDAAGAVGNAVATFYIFLGLALVCDEFFQPALEEISEALSLSPDVAGATFLAAGSSAPELFTSLADAFGESTSIGISTIVGSAMFNILVIVALACAVAGRSGGSLLIDWRPVFRDVFYYVMSILILVGFFWDEKVEWFEALIMVMLYGSYILFMTQNEKAFDMMSRLARTQMIAPYAARNMTDTAKMLPVPVPQVESPTSADVELAPIGAEVALAGDDAAGKGEGDGGEEGGEAAGKGEEEEESLFHRFEVPKEAPDLVLFVLNLPFLVLFTVFIPDCTHPFFKKCWAKIYWVSFFMSIVTIALLCHFMVEFSLHFACIMNWSPLVIGLLVLSVGTSIPDAIGSAVAAKNGEADMAVANAVGSNVFDILLGLGGPWLGVIIKNGHSQQVDKGGVLAYTVVLMVTVVIFVTILVAARWKLNRNVGFAMLSLYLAFVIFSIAIE